MMYIMIGLPGSGKSTWTREQNLPIISADLIREEWYGDISIQGDGPAIFKELYSRVDAAISQGIDFIVDNTSVDVKSRKNYIGRGTDVTAVFVNTPVDVCLRRNSLRDDRSEPVPEDVILKMANRLTPPSLDEGFSNIIVIS